MRISIAPARPPARRSPPRQPRSRFISPNSSSPNSAPSWCVTPPAGRFPCERGGRRRVEGLAAAARVRSVQGRVALDLGRHPFEQGRVHLSRRQIGSPRVRRTSPPGRDGVGDPLIFIRMIHFAATLSLAGAVIFGAAIAGPIMRQMEDAGAALRARLMRIAWWSFAAALISGTAWLVLLAAEISERAPGEIFSEGILSTVLLHTTFGHDWLARLGLAALLADALGGISVMPVCILGWAHREPR